MFLSVENIKTLKSEKFISEEAFDNEFKVRPEDGDVLMTRIGDIGTANVVRSNARIAYYVSLALLKPIDVDSNFLVMSIASPFVQRGLWTRTLHIAFPKKINKNEIEKVDIIVPCKEEQQKIGQLFIVLDHLITLHQREYDKTVNVKKAMLEKMFPKEGENKPEIRFAGFTDAWEQRKLLSCIQKIIDFRGRTPKKLGMDWSEDGYLALSALNVKDGYIDFSQEVHYGSQELYDKWMAGNDLHEGQVLFTTEAPMGNVAQVPDNRRYILSQRTIAFDVQSKIITEDFLATILRSPIVFAMLTALSSGGTAKGVSQKSLSTIDIIIPTKLKEQEQIANLFLDLDHLSTLHQRELEKLQNMKKALLEKMFI